MIITFDNVSKIKPIPGTHKKKYILESASFSFNEGDRVSLLGVKGSGVPTVLKLISGSELPTTGKIFRRGSFSPPIGDTGSFHGDLTGEENIRFICKLYGQQPKQVINFVKDFLEADKALRQPTKTYQGGFGKNVAFALSIAMKFDTYLVITPIPTGNSPDFQKKCMDAFTERTKDASLILTSNSVKLVRNFTDRAMVIHKGAAILFDDVEAGLLKYRRFHRNNTGTI